MNRFRLRHTQGGATAFARLIQGRISVANTLTCKCGQMLDVAGFAAGQRVRCPQCKEILTIATPPPPSQEPPVAMAAVIDDESDVTAAAGQAPLSAAQRMAAQRASDRAASRKSVEKFARFLFWPSLVLGLLSLGVAGIGFYYEFLAPKTIQIEKDSSGIEHYYANVLKEGSKDQFERIEIKPDVMPGDKVTYDADDNPIITLKGLPITRDMAGYYKLTIDDKKLTAEERGWWFYEVDLASDKDPKPIIRKLDIPLVAQDKAAMRYVPVTIDGTEFSNKTTSQPVNVAFYRAEDKYLTTQLGRFKVTDAPPMNIPPWVFIAAGIPIGLFLLGMAGLFGYQMFIKGRKAEGQAQQA
jgi:phage FluMu protein Com